MACGAQIKALLKSHADDDESQFYAVALQVAAAEARKGHADVARELHDMAENSRKREVRHEVRENVLHIAQPDSELSDLLTMTEPKMRLSELVLDEAVLSRIRRILSEQHHLDRLKSHALRPSIAASQRPSGMWKNFDRFRDCRRIGPPVVYSPT